MSRQWKMLFCSCVAGFIAFLPVQAESDKFLAEVRDGVRNALSEPAVRALYKTQYPDIPDVAKSDAYWTWLLSTVLDNGTFSWSESQARTAYFTYWSEVFEENAPPTMDCKIGLAQLVSNRDRDRAAFAQTLDELFAAGPQNDPQHIMKFIRATKNEFRLREKYEKLFTYETAGVDGMIELVEMMAIEMNSIWRARSTLKTLSETLPYDEISDAELLRLVRLASGMLQDSGMAATLAGHLKLPDMDDAGKLELAREMMIIDGAIATIIFGRMQDQTIGQLELFNHFLKKQDYKALLPVAAALMENEKYAERVALPYAKALEDNRQYAEAAAIYQANDDGALDTLQSAVRCYQALDDSAGAVRVMRRIMETYKDQRLPVAVQIAQAYQRDRDRAAARVAWRSVLDMAPLGSAEEALARQQLNAIPPGMPDVEMMLPDR